METLLPLISFVAAISPLQPLRKTVQGGGELESKIMGSCSRSAAKMELLFDFTLPFCLNLCAQDLHSGTVRHIAPFVEQLFSSVNTLVEGDALGSAQERGVHTVLQTILEDTPAGEILPSSTRSLLHAFWTTSTNVLEFRNLRCTGRRQFRRNPVP